MMRMMTVIACTGEQTDSVLVGLSVFSDPDWLFPPPCNGFSFVPTLLGRSQVCEERDHRKDVFYCNLSQEPKYTYITCRGVL